MKPITTPQLQLIHYLLKKQNLMDSKPDLCFSFSNGRTESSRELTMNEASELISYLKNNDNRSEYIRRIWYLGYQSGIIYGNTPEDKAINSAMLNLFCKKKGVIKKPLHEQELDELKRTVRQFEAIAKKSFVKQAVDEFIAFFEYTNEQLVEAEQYEDAASNKKAIEFAINNPKEVVKYFKRNPELIDRAIEAYIILNNRKKIKTNHFAKI